MSDKTNGKTEIDEPIEEQEVEINSIRFDFESFASVNFIVHTKGKIVPLQLLAVAHWLEFEGKNALANQKAMAAQMAAEQKSQIQRPEPGIVLPSGR